MANRNSNNIQLWFADFPDLVLDVREFKVREAISGLFVVTATAVSKDHDLPLDNLVDRGAGMSLRRPGRKPLHRIWTGLCSQVLHLSAQPGKDSVYHLTISPELWRLTLRQNCRIFLDRSIPEIVKEILDDWEITPIWRNFKVEDYDLFPKLEYRVQYEESDYAFICRLLEEAGISFYFEYKNVKKGKGRDLTTLVLDSNPEKASEGDEDEEEGEEADEAQDGDVDGSDAEEEDDAAPGEEEEEQKEKKVRGPLPYLGHHDDPEMGISYETVVNAGIARNVRPGAVTLIDHDFRRELGARVSASAELDEYPEAKYEQFRYTPGLLHKNAESGDTYDGPRGRRQVETELFAIRANSMVSRFITNAIDVCPGTVIKFGGVSPRPDALFDTPPAGEHPRMELGKNRKHLVIESTMAGDTMGRWSVTCRAVTAESEFRPPRATPKPKISGVQSALVVGPSTETKEEIHCDKYGRVKIQFHWDRQHKYGADGGAKDLATCWVRVATPMAGSGYGFVAIPRVGHEVLVSFLDGDPDRPVIVGSVYNQFNPPPYTLPDEKTRTGLKTNSSPEGEGFNELYWDDRKGKELFYMQAQSALSEVVKGAENHSVGATRTTRVGTEDKLHVGNKFELAVGQNHTGIMVQENTLVIIQVGGAQGAQLMLSGSSIYLTAKSDIHLHAGANIHLSAQGKINIDGGEVHINDRTPVPATYADLVPAAAKPARGAAIAAGPKPKGGGGMPDAPKRIAADVELGPDEPIDELSNPEGVLPHQALDGEADGVAPTATGLAPGVLPRTPGATPGAPSPMGPLAAAMANPAMIAQVAAQGPSAIGTQVAAVAAGSVAAQVAPGVPGVGQVAASLGGALAGGASMGDAARGMVPGVLGAAAGAVAPAPIAGIAAAGVAAAAGGTNIAAAGAQAAVPALAAAIGGPGAGVAAAVAAPLVGQALAGGAPAPAPAAGAPAAAPAAAKPPPPPPVPPRKPDGQ